MFTTKPKTSRGKRAQEDREPKVYENTKTAMFIKGNKSSQLIQDVLKDLYHLKKPDAVWYARKELNKFLPFEDVTSLEFYSSKTDSSLFAFGSHSKKRPNNLVLGRMFNFHLLDMIEFGVDNFKAIHKFTDSETNAIGSKPCFVLQGEAFNTEEVFNVVANVIVDFFRGEVVDSINLAGLDHVIFLCAENGVIQFRHYFIRFKKSGTKTPNVDLEEIGPSMDLTIRRHRLASYDLRQESLKMPKGIKPTKQKNIKTSTMKETLGTLHVPSQNFDKLTTKHTRGLKRARAPSGGDGLEDSEGGHVAAPSAGKQSKRVD